MSVSAPLAREERGAIVNSLTPRAKRQGRLFNGTLTDCRRKWCRGGVDATLLACVMKGPPSIEVVDGEEKGCRETVDELARVE